MCNNNKCDCNGVCKCHNQIILKDMDNTTKDNILKSMYQFPQHIYLTANINTKQYGDLLCNVIIIENGQFDFCIINKPTGFYIRTQKGVRSERFTSLGRLISDLKRAIKQDSRVLSLDKIYLVSEIRNTKKEVVSK